MVGHNSAEDGIPQVLESFVADSAPVIQFNCLGLMTKRKFVQKNIPGIIPENIFQSYEKLFVFREKDSDRLNDVESQFTSQIS